MVISLYMMSVALLTCGRPNITCSDVSDVRWTFGGVAHSRKNHKGASLFDV